MKTTSYCATIWTGTERICTGFFFDTVKEARHYCDVLTEGNAEGVRLRISKKYRHNGFAYVVYDAQRKAGGKRFFRTI